MPGRQFSSNGYRYGFNGKEKDDEVKSVEGSSLDFGERIYDSRLSRFISLDPLGIKTPNYSPYSYASNKPIIAIDKAGLHTFYVNVHTNPDGENGNATGYVVTSVEVFYEANKPDKFIFYDVSNSNHMMGTYPEAEGQEIFDDKARWAVNDAMEMYESRNKNVTYSGFPDNYPITMGEKASALISSVGGFITNLANRIDNAVVGDTYSPTTRPFNTFSMGASSSRKDKLGPVEFKSQLSSEVYSKGENTAGFNNAAKSNPVVSIKGYSTPSGQFSNKAYFKFYTNANYSPQPTEGITLGIAQPALEINVNLSFFYITNNTTEGSFTTGVQWPPQLGIDATEYGPGVKAQHTTKEINLNGK